MVKLLNDPSTHSTGSGRASSGRAKVVLFDIDYTLFDTERLRKNLYKRLADVLGQDKEEVEEIARQIYKDITSPIGYFKPDYFANEMAKRVNRQEKKRDIEQAIWDARNFEGNFYDETEDVLKALAKIATVGIFSKGYDRFQRAKLAVIEHLLGKDHIHITINKKLTLPELLDKYKHNTLYLVDDALDTLYEAKKLDNRIFVIWIRRGKYAMRQAPIASFTPDAQAANLRGIEKLIREN